MATPNPTNAHPTLGAHFIIGDTYNPMGALWSPHPQRPGPPTLCTPWSWPQPSHILPFTYPAATTAAAALHAQVSWFNSVQFSRSVVSHSATPWTAARQASLSIPTPGVYSNSCPLSRWCHPTISSSVIPFFSRLQSFPASGSFPSESVLHIRWPKYWSFSFSISPFSEYSGLISFRMDWLDLLAVQGTLRSLLQHHGSKAPGVLVPVVWHHSTRMEISALLLALRPCHHSSRPPHHRGGSHPELALPTGGPAELLLPLPSKDGILSLTQWLLFLPLFLLSPVLPHSLSPRPQGWIQEASCWEGCLGTE